MRHAFRGQAAAHDRHHRRMERQTVAAATGEVSRVVQANAIILNENLQGAVRPVHPHAQTKRRRFNLVPPVLGGVAHRLTGRIEGDFRL